MTDSEPKQPRPPFPVSELDYELPEELIAQAPPAKREDARLLVVNRKTNKLTDSGIDRLPNWLREGDLLVLNDTKVLAAKFFARRQTGAQLSGLYLHDDKAGVWRVMIRGSRKLRVGEVIELVGPDDERVGMELIASYGHGQWSGCVNTREAAESLLSRIGEAPLPPYIRREQSGSAEHDFDLDRYQTVFAKVPGAVAAPTAGLHLTDVLLKEFRSRGVLTTTVTLHVGLGTFKPVEADDLSLHEMHSERYELSEEAARDIAACRRRGGRVVAVGTTSVRVLESCGRDGTATEPVTPGAGETGIFIYPPYRFSVVDAMLTNFHLPKSTLIALVMAFAGIDLTREAYRHVIGERYRFYSYGDAMLVL